MIIANVGMCMVDSDAGIHFEPFIDGISVHDIGTDAGRLEVGNDKSPASTPVVLIFAIHARTHFVTFAQREVYSEVRSPGILHETALQRAVWTRHVTMTYGLAQFLAVIVLPCQVGFYTQVVALP